MTGLSRKRVREEGEDMYRDQGGSSKSEIGPFDRKRINDALDRQLEKSASSYSKGMNGKDKERFLVPSTSVGKQPDLRLLSKNKPLDSKFMILATPFAHHCIEHWGPYRTLLFDV